MASIYRYRYIPSKPVKFNDLGDARWSYVEAPPSMVANMAGLPVSQHEFGVIATDRFLSDALQNQLGLTPIASGVALPPKVIKLGPGFTEASESL